jgi:hypothetical protein
MQVNQIIAISIAGSIISIAIATPSWANPKQYRSGYAAGVARGQEVGKMDGSGEAGTNAMHTNATCQIEQPKSKDYDRLAARLRDRGYDRGCRTTYKKTFEQAYKNRKQNK